MKKLKNELFSFIRTTGNENQRWLDGDSRQKSYIMFWQESNFFHAFSNHLEVFC